jgi:hypothetical protein
VAKLEGLAAATATRHSMKPGGSDGGGLVGGAMP